MHVDLQNKNSNRLTIIEFRVLKKNSFLSRSATYVTLWKAQYFLVSNINYLLVGGGMIIKGKSKNSKIIVHLILVDDGVIKNLRIYDLKITDYP